MYTQTINLLASAVSAQTYLLNYLKNAYIYIKQFIEKKKLIKFKKLFAIF